MKRSMSQAQYMRDQEALRSKLAEQQAMIDYLSMMSGIGIDDDDEGDVEDDEEQEI